MEISVRDWMIIIGVLLIVAVLLDGYRRMRDPKRIRMSLTKVPDGPDNDISMTRELPNGGARVTARPESASPAAPPASDATPPEPEPVAQDEPDAEPAQAVDLSAVAEAITAEPPLLTERVDLVEEPEDEPDPLFDAPAPAMRAERANVAPGENLDLLEGMGADDEGGERTADAPQEVLMLHVVSRDDTGFPGDDILQVLLAYNLRFGEMDFFHRHEEGSGRGAIQFSVANMLQPGVFDIDRMADFSTTGLIFFLTLPGPRDMMGAFELMLETARGVAEHLGGDVLDETRSATTRQTLEHMRQRIRDLERKLLAQAGR